MCKTLNQCSEHMHKARHVSAHLKSQHWGSRDRRMGALTRIANQLPLASVRHLHPKIQQR